MLLKAIINVEDQIEECFEITNYYTETGDYLEADIDDQKGIGGRQIILCDGGQYLGESENWVSITITSDSGVELLKFENKLEEQE